MPVAEKRGFEAVTATTTLRSSPQSGDGGLPATIREACRGLGQFDQAFA